MDMPMNVTVMLPVRASALAPDRGLTMEGLPARAALLLGSPPFLSSARAKRHAERASRTSALTRLIRATGALQSQRLRDQDAPRGQQQAQHDALKGPRRDAHMGARADPGGDHRGRQAHQRDPDQRLSDLPVDRHGGARDDEHDEIERLVDRALAARVAAAQLQPDQRRRCREARESAEEAANDADDGIGELAAPGADLARSPTDQLIERIDDQEGADRGPQ